MWLSPISPSSSALGTRAATESTTTTSTAPVDDQRTGDFERLFAVVRLRNDQIVDIDAEFARIGRIERVFGIDEAAAPPAFCAWAITCSASVVLPDDSGPKISITRPRGKPPTPSAESSEMEPLEITRDRDHGARSKQQYRSFPELLIQLAQGR